LPLAAQFGLSNPLKPCYGALTYVITMGMQVAFQTQVQYC